MTLRPAEQIQKPSAIDIGVGEVLRQGAFGEFLDFRPRARRDVDGIVELLRRQTARQSVRKIGLVRRIPVITFKAELVGSRRYNRPHQFAQVVAGCQEIFRQSIQQCRVRGRIRRSNIIDGFDDSTGKEIAPHPVRHRLGKQRIVASRQPVSQQFPDVFLPRGVLLAIEKKLRRHDPAVFRMVNLGIFALVENDLLIGIDAIFDSNGRKERTQVVVLILGPLLEWMIVALRANHPHSQKELRRGFHGDLRIAREAQKVRRRIMESGALGCHQFANHSIVRPVLLQRLLDPIAERPDAFVAQLCSVHLQKVAPLHGPMRKVFRPRHQAIDLFSSLDPRVALIRQERLRLFRSRRQADQVDGNAPQKLFVRRQLRG